jgi:hypothetical protein
MYVLDVDLTTVALPLAAAGLPRKEMVVYLVQPASSASQTFVIGIHAQAAGLPRKEMVVYLVQPAASASQNFVFGIHAQAV